MSVADQQPADEVGDPGRSLSAIVIADSPTTQRRATAALSDHGMQSSAQFAAPSAVAGLDLDADTIIVFACNVDVPREMTGLRSLRREARRAAIVVVSPPTTSRGVRRALGAGADALVFESEIELTLAAAVRAVASGQSVVPRKLRAGIERPNLSHREREVLVLVRRGLTNAEIAKSLFLAESTIKSHLASIFTKSGVHSRNEAATLFTDPSGQSSK